MEGSRFEKLKNLRERGLAYPHKFDTNHQIGDLRNKYERPTDGREVSIKGIVKRVSKLEDAYLVRLSDASGVEMLVITEQELQAGKEYTL